VAGGCGGFSLLGLLIGIGLTVWLGSMAVDGMRPATKDASPLTASGTSTSVAGATAPEVQAVEVTVSPQQGLAEDATVTVASDGFPADAEVSVTTCLAGSGSAKVAAGAPCDPASTATFRTDAAGHLAASYRPSRLVTASGMPFDCASAPKQCRLQVAATASPHLVGSVDISFDPGLGSPQITLPGG
jgi:hypothetical protein